MMVGVLGPCSHESQHMACMRLSLGDVACANSVGFQGLVQLLLDFCQQSVLEVGVCGVYSESP